MKPPTLFLTALLILTLSPLSKAAPCFYEPFEGFQTIINNNATFTDLSFYTGINGTAVFINSSSQLSYPANNNLNTTSGSIDFWFSPNWSGNDDKIHYFFSWKSGNSAFRIFKHHSPSGKSYFVFRVDDSNGQWREASTSADEPGVVMKWKPGEWHHLSAVWDFSRQNQFIFMLLDNFSKTTYFTWNMSDTPSEFFVGSYPKTTTFDADSLIDDLKIYNYPPYDPQDPTSIANLTKGDRTCQPYETIYNSEGDCPILNDTLFPSQDIIFFQTLPFSRVFENTLPQENTITHNLLYTASRNEFEPLFFNIYTRKNLTSLRISISDFYGPDYKIPRENADLRVVKNWFQAGTGVKKGMPHYIPELLLYNDTVPLENKDWNSSHLPSLPKLNHVYTTMKAYTSKQFLVTLKIPKDAIPGIYNATLLLQDPNTQQTAINITLKVLPITLPKPRQTFIIYYQGKLSQGYSDSVSPQRLDAQIKDIADHGFNGICLYPEYRDNEISYQQQKLSTAKKHNITKMAIFISFKPELKTLLEDYGYEPYFYGKDEPNTDEKLIEHIQQSITIHNGEGKVITAIQKSTADRLDNPHDPIYSNFPEGTYEPLDIANLATGPRYADYFHSLINGSFVRTRNETYYWQIMQEDPKINRFMSGFFLWSTGLDGIFPYVYQSVRGNPYNDFDVWSQKIPSYRDHLVTYPSIEGPVPTIQWEALREGIDDTRYLTLWKNLTLRVSRYNSSLANLTTERINTILEKYRNYFNITSIPISQYTEDRNAIISQILLLQNTAFIKTDTNSNGIIDMPELITFIRQWKNTASYTLNDLLGIIAFWKHE